MANPLVELSVLQVPNKENLDFFVTNTGLKQHNVGMQHYRTHQGLVADSAATRAEPVPEH